MRIRTRRSVMVMGLLVTGLACAPRPAPYEGSPTRGQMITHFDYAVEARGAALSGDVTAFRNAAKALAELQPARDLPPDVILQLGPMRWEAREGTLVKTADEAAMAAARIAQTCGDCHTANHVPLGERFTLGGPPPAGSTARHMAGLAWASRLLWDGLIGPSDRTWSTGAAGIVELGLLPEGLRPMLPPGDAAVYAARLRQLGERAVLTRDSDRRVEVLAEIWGTCAECHAETRSGSE